MPSEANDKLKQEFNQWAADGRGEEMEGHHISIAEQTLALMDLKPGDSVLDLGCGAGWATRKLAKAVDGLSANGEAGRAIGLDISDEMINRARDANKDVPGIGFVCGPADHLPFESGSFDKVLSIESFYYYPDQDKVLDELRRVLVPGGKLYILINLYTENHYSLRWVGELKVAVHARSEKEYISMLERHGFKAVESRRIPDETPTPETYSGKWFKSAEELRDFKQIGALLLIATRP